jgi:hypothetical protein
VGEKVPGEKKRIGAVAERFYEEQQEKGAVPDKPFPDGVNCDIDRKPTAQERHLRLSDLIIGTAALLPAALKIGRDVRNQISEKDRAA